MQIFKDDESQQFLKDETVAKKFADAKKLSDVDASQYDAIFYVGGHGPVIDLASDPVNIELANQVSRTRYLRWLLPDLPCSSGGQARLRLLSATDLRMWVYIPNWCVKLT